MTRPLLSGQVRRAFPEPAHRVEVAGTGAEGLERIRAWPPDVILLDLLLPDQSGLEVYQQIRRIDARIPVTFITMAKKADAAIEAMRQGAYDYLFKPLDMQQLRRVLGVEAWVVRQRLQPDVRNLYADANRELDRLMLPRVMEHTRGSQHQAALLLGIARQTLRLKLRDLGLSIVRPHEAEEDGSAEDRLPASHQAG